MVKSVPVYLSTKLQEQLHLLQFPIRTTSFNEAEIKKMEVRYKPNTKYLEMDVPIPVDSPNYDKEKGKDLIKGINEGNIVLAEQTVRTEYTKKFLFILFLDFWTVKPCPHLLYHKGQLIMPLLSKMENCI